MMEIKTVRQRTFRSLCCLIILSLWLWLLSAFKSTAVEERDLSDTPNGQKKAVETFSDYGYER